MEDKLAVYWHYTDIDINASYEVDTVGRGRVELYMEKNVPALLASIGICRREISGSAENVIMFSKFMPR